MSENGAVHSKPNYGRVFWSLLFLTIFEIVTANSPFPKFAIVLLLVFLALMKASLVALFYMHLKFEKFVFYLIVLFQLLLAVTLTVIMLSDKQ